MEDEYTRRVRRIARETDAVVHSIVPEAPDVPEPATDLLVACWLRFQGELAHKFRLDPNEVLTDHDVMVARAYSSWIVANFEVAPRVSPN